MDLTPPRRHARRRVLVAAAIAGGLMTGLLTNVTAAPAAPPQQCLQKITIGTSVKGRPIVACQLGNPALKPMLLIGEIHGNERAGRATAAQLMATKLPQSAHVWVIPTMNPDGHAMNRRQNARGVDLNRNFPKDWRKRTGVYASGWKPASEPETRAVMSFIKKYKPATTVVAHQPFNLVDVSDGGDRRVSQRLATLTKTRLVKLSDRLPSGAKKYTGTLTAWANANVWMSTAITYEFAGGRVPAWRQERLAWAVIVLSKERAKHLYRSRIDAKVAPTTITAGGTVTVNAWLSAESRAGTFTRASGRTVQVWAKTRGVGEWTRIWVGRSNASGAFAVKAKPTRATCYQARFASNRLWESKNTAPKCVSVKPAPTP